MAQPYPPGGEPPYGSPGQPGGQPSYGSPGQPGGQPPHAAPGQPYGSPGQPGGQPYGAPGQPDGTQYPPPDLWPGGPQQPAPRPRRTGLIIAIVAAVVLAAGGLTAFLLLRDSGPASPSEAVQEYMEGHRDGDVAQIDAVYCAKYDAAKSLSEYQEENITELTWKILGEEIDGDKAKVNAELTVTKDGKSETNTGKLDLVNEDGWKVCESP